MNKAYRRGFTARSVLSLAREANPYDVDTKESEAWYSGHFDGERAAATTFREKKRSAMKRLTLDEIYPMMGVTYVPLHAAGDMNHADCEHGVVSSKNDHCAFVKFDRTVSKLGWEGTTSQSCRPGDLVSDAEAAAGRKLQCKL